uniref:Fucolectin tachylectin-4 pentraxin-1 domain-containing protein n=1 Tax=Petromyzon marinus TaxID=7757 RepID=S4RV93_PETMA
CSITDMDWEPWWRLDMLLLYRVKSVTIAGREDVQGLRLFGAEIRVGNSTTREDNSFNPSNDIFVTSGQSAAFYCLPWLVGRFLIVALPGRIDSLGLCEVSLL